MLGWILLNKPVGISSSKALTPIKQLLRKKIVTTSDQDKTLETKIKIPKVGHAGTLDPFAEGLLVVGVGQATRLINYAMDGIKEYICTVQWGEERDTGDTTGLITAQSDVTPIAAEIQKAFANFLGLIKQKPHIYSAIKIKGERSYNLAREGRSADLLARSVEVKELELLEHNLENRSSIIRILCSKGFYVRSFVIDLAKLLGTYGYAAKLCRTRVGKFLLDNALKMTYICDQVNNAKNNVQAFFADKKLFLPPTAVFDKCQILNISYDNANKLLNGRQIQDSGQVTEGKFAVISDCKLVAIVVIKNAIWTPIVVFNNQNNSGG
mgnify:CR=1 FL=1